MELDGHLDLGAAPLGCEADAVVPFQEPVLPAIGDMDVHERYDAINNLERQHSCGTGLDGPRLGRQDTAITARCV